VACHRGKVSDVDRSIGLIAGADAIDPVLHVILIGSLSGKRGSVFAIELLGKVAGCRL